MDMILIEGGEFAMGAARFYAEERPVRRVRVAPFRIDALPVTNAAFARFVTATGYTTVAERPRGAATGSLVFVRPTSPVSLDDPAQWWRFVAGASWRRPRGPASSLAGLEDHPVVHVAYEDALAYAAWVGKALPSEAQWEFAARGGLDGADYAWGNALAPEAMMLANYWQGAFPLENTLADGWEFTAPVGSFPANGYGLYDMIGNVWEWTADAWSAPGHPARDDAAPCCAPAPDAPAARRVIKGGSYLCAANYCQRYRPAARQGQAVDVPTGHLGLRCVSPA
ncbi:MAG: formylglycine-generating enzyme family protein [Burkholderiales bacterium]|nr:formylglycine-generating enzyme family protein [Burkholderiales bacterium]